MLLLRSVSPLIGDIPFLSFIRGMVLLDDLVRICPDIRGGVDVLVTYRNTEKQYTPQRLVTSIWRRRGIAYREIMGTRTLPLTYIRRGFIS
jgi:hypothetical protein